MSIAMRIITTVKQNARTGSREVYSHVLSDAVQLAIGSGLTFDITDWEPLAHPPSYRSVAPLACLGGERAYALAITVGNMSFIRMFEEGMKRHPFFANKVDMLSSGYTHGTPSVQRSRLAVGFAVRLEDRRAEVTSMTNERAVLVAYRYEGQRAIPERRWILTPDDCRERWTAKIAKAKEA